MICMKGKVSCPGYKDGECISVESCRFQDYFYDDYRKGCRRCSSDLYCHNKENGYCLSNERCEHKL